ncbi:SDR family oxidoreductase [Leptospira sp. 3 VSF25]|uniref:dTDP-4-dehydrorhamnose reductase n=2 Tax=Leptospira limi TaxID=2950023 RepID=A0ABT3LZZ1_9LEPT|nr:SDR family oxidoreductase [Leptospira limi]
MLGSTLFNVLSKNSKFKVWGTVRNPEVLKYIKNLHNGIILTHVDVMNQDELIRIFYDVKPDVVINCIGIIKQQKVAEDPLTVIPINSLLPHRLSSLCKLIGARLILISTDCVFDGKRGMYVESDPPNAIDLYGKSKELGEIYNDKHVFTFRTSIIGHELNSQISLVNWFLSQQGIVRGFSKAIFSGFPANEIAEIIENKIIPNEDLFGLYHVSAEPISKFDLLQLIKKLYGFDIEIKLEDDFEIDRSLNSEKFRKETGYIPKKWDKLVQDMKDYRKEYLD